MSILDDGEFDVEVRIKFRPRRFYQNTEEKIAAQKIQSTADLTAIVLEKRIESIIKEVMQDESEAVLSGLRLDNGANEVKETNIP